MIYLPTDRYFKSVNGAVAAGTSLRLRVVLPRYYGVNGCRLVLSADRKPDRSLPMTWEGTDGISETWICDLTADEAGLFFYRFEFTTPVGSGSVMHTADSLIGEFYGDRPWQLTVYEADFRTPDAFKGGILYQIFPDRFYNSGQPKTGVPDDRILRSDTGNAPYWRKDEQGRIRNNDYFGGDFKGIIEKLGRLEELGVTCLYLNPICEAHSNHRYDTADYLRPDPLLGTEEDFKDLCEECHRRGIKVILDGVFSHTGADSVYFNKYGRYGEGGAFRDPASPYRRWYTFRPDGTYRSWWNIDILPEVNEEDETFTRFITGKGGVIEKWFSLGADGFRLDVADELPDRFLDDVRTCIKNYSPDCYLLGEVWEDATNKISHGGRRRFLLGSQLDGVMNYPFRNAIIDFLLKGKAEQFMAAVGSVVDNYPPEAMNVCMNHLGTHDTERILTVLAGIDAGEMTREEQAKAVIAPEKLPEAIRLLKMAVSINYTLPGIPSVYYGDEAGMTGCRDPFNRGCYPWGAENGEILRFMKEIGRFRRNAKVLAEGGFYPISATLGCVAYLRYSPGLPRVFIAANRNDREIDYRLHDDMKDMRCVFGGTKNDGGVLIPPMTCAILTD